MAYLAPIHRPSSVRYALKLNLLDADTECLVVAKANRLEVWNLSEEGLSMEISRPIFGCISMLSKIRPIGSTTDHLFVGTQRFQYFTIAWNPETRKLETINTFEDASEKHVRDSQSRDLCLVDPAGQYFALELFEGVINFIRIKHPRKGHSKGYLDKAEQVRITELKVRASTFLYTELQQPKIAFLHDNGQDDIRLVTYRIVDDKNTVSGFDPNRDREDDIGDLDIGANILIPVPRKESATKRYVVRNSTASSAPKAYLGGVIVVGELKMTYFDDESKAVIESDQDKASIYRTWERFDDTNYILADDFGVLHLLTINMAGDEVTGIGLNEIGRTAPATVMVHMGDGLLFIGSHEGDSQLVQLDLTPENQSLTILQTFENIAPIFDFAVMDMGSREGDQSNEYSSGQARLVTGSGSFEAGSLRSVRSGVGLTDVGILADIEDIQGVFTLRSTSSDSLKDDIIVVSLPIETRIFSFDSEGEIEEVDSFKGLKMDGHTLLAKNLSDGLILQVTDVGVSILGPGPAFVVAQWVPPAGQHITAVSSNENYVLLSANGSTLVSLDLSRDLQEIVAQHLDGDEIACIHVPEGQNIGVVGFWKSGTISLLNLPSLQIIHSENLRQKNNASIPRDIAMAQLLPNFGLTLFVAMEDGVVLTFQVDTSTFALSGRKSIILGMHQARFSVLPRKDGLYNIFASCEHPSLIYGSEGRVVYSAVTAEDAICVSSFDSVAYPDSIVVATSGEIKISQIDVERRTHVSTLHLGSTVRRIAYSARERAFGLGLINRKLFKGEEIITSSFSLVEDVSFGQLCEPSELLTIGGSGTELIDCIIRAELPTAHGDRQPGERFIIGTSFLDEETSTSNINGRILVIGIDSNTRKPYPILEHHLKSACRKLAILDGKILAALNKTVVLFSYNEDTETSATLTKLATYRCATLPIDLAVHGNTVAISDIMKSASLIEYTPGENGLPDKFEEVARHQLAIWSTGISYIEDDSYLESDHDGNLIVLKRNREGVTLEDRMRLEVTSELHLGEMVNRIQKIVVEPTAGAMVNPKAFIATSEGSIYLFATILPQSQDLLLRLQDKISSTISSLGDLSFNTYRGFKNNVRVTEEPFRFVDGELIEKFLDVEEDVQREICKGLGPSVEDVRDMVEELKRLH